MISFGFWFGDDRFPEPAFYSYTSPEPAGLADEPLEPAQASWTERGSNHLAVLPWAALRTARQPRAAALAFLESEETPLDPMRVARSSVLSIFAGAGVAAQIRCKKRRGQ